MQNLALHLSKGIQQALRCPICKSPMVHLEDELRCTHDACAKSFPVIAGIPILINESASLFNIDDYVHSRGTT